MSLGGFLAIRNGELLDYCWREAIRSMLPICDQVVVSESESSDGTREALNAWALQEPKLRIVSYPWTNPRGDSSWWPTRIKIAREYLNTEFACYLDADEVFHEESYQEIIDAVKQGRTLLCNRLNFWRDPRTLIPRGHCCGSEVIRVGPQRCFFPSDYPDDRAIEIMSLGQPSKVQIHHYGFLRRRDAFFRKARTVLQIWCNSYDPRLEKAERFDGNWMTMPGINDWLDLVVPFTGTHPEVIRAWLIERGHVL